MAITRLAQRVHQVIDGVSGDLLRPRAFYDCNPPSKAHWTYQLFVIKRDPDTKLALRNPDDYAHYQINPETTQKTCQQGIWRRCRVVGQTQEKVSRWRICRRYTECALYGRSY